MPFPGEFYGPELLRVVEHAIEDACVELRSTGGDDGRITRLMMSLRLMTAVAADERDPARLKLLALSAVAATESRMTPQAAPDAQHHWPRHTVDRRG